MAAINLKSDLLKFSDVSQDADYYDDWLFTSARRYKHINMYETEKSISAAEWHGDGCERIIVGTSEALNNELLMYRMPAVNVEEVDRLSKNRELSIVAAASCTGPCHSLVSAPPTFKDPNIMVRTEHSSTKMFIHSLVNEISDSTISDLQLLHTLDPFNSPTDSPTIQLVGTSNLVCSVSIHKLLWYDVLTQQKVELLCKGDDMLNEPVSTLLSTEENTCIVSGARTGCTISVDKRAPNVYTKLLPSVADKGVRWLLCGTRGQEVIRLNDNNELSLGDMRKPGTITCQCRLEGPIKTRRNVPFTSHICGNILSLSGKDNKVRLYNLQTESDEVLQPIFTHDGHLPDVEGGDMPSITTHSWSNSDTSLLASATNTGQLHIWLYANHKS